MKKLTTFLAVAILAPMLTACGPSPEKLCNHMMDIMKKDMPDGADAPSDEDIKKGMEKCVEGVNKEKEKNPEDFKTKAKCVMAASDMEGVMKCDKDDDKDE